MAKNSTAEKNLELQEVYETAEQQWASRVINTLLVESQKGELTLPRYFTLNGISITRNKTDNGWAVGFHILETT